MKTSLFDYKLPKELIAQVPLKKRDESRLLVLNKKTGSITEDKYKNLANYLEKGDVLVFNNSKVIPAKFEARVIETGEEKRKINILLLRMVTNSSWEVLLGGRKKYDKMRLSFGKGVIAVARKTNSENWILEFNLKDKVLQNFIEKYGKTPLPPYIKKEASLKNYQNIYAKTKGSVAAPTAGFHFTKELLDKIRKKGVNIEFVTLHVGIGTFLPVKTKNLEEHKIHSETVELTKSSVKFLNKAKKEGKRIIAVGTTSARVLEACCNENNELTPHKGGVSIFIYPPYKFKFVDCLVTNFHLPKSTLLALVSAFAGRGKMNMRGQKSVASSPFINKDPSYSSDGVRMIKKAYKYAIKNKFRFFSFGDGMFIK